MKHKKSKKKSRGNNSLKPKISAMIWEFAGDYIRMGENIEQRQYLLNSACTAWNISLLKGKNREKAIQTYLDTCEELNPDHDENYRNNLEEDFRLLIKEKERMFPEVKKQIIHTEIRHISGKDNITVASMEIN